MHEIPNCTRLAKRRIATPYLGKAAIFANGAPLRRFLYFLGVLAFSINSFAIESQDLVPPVKKIESTLGILDLKTCRIVDHDEQLSSNTAILSEFLIQRSIALGASGTTIQLQLGPLALPVIQSAYQEDIRDQAYLLKIDSDGIVIRAEGRAGIFYGIQTLKQLVGETNAAPYVEILDWPDLAFRGVMVDPARANENAEYYSRLIEFCGRYKLNRIHLHLTDDQNVTLYHDGYEPLMHPNAWRTESLRHLVKHASRFHIELIPEIESLGHARVFLRHPDFKQYLHQTEANKPPGSWVGTTQAGYTNVLCPASERAATYLADMYALTASIFDYPVIHLGCDEVDMTKCGRCSDAFPGVSSAQWFAQHLQHCQRLAAKHDRRVAVWGDMLIKQPQILDRLTPDDFVIYDWHYKPEVSEKSVRLFKKKGFEVIACPALVCYPHMTFPSNDNHANIRRFTQIAREHDLRGVNTTIWIPTRYLSDALWSGIAYAAAHAWSGERCEDAPMYEAFAQDFFCSQDGDAFAEVFMKILSVDWRLDRFRMSCWFDDETLASAREMAAGPLRSEAEACLQKLESASRTLSALRSGARENRIAWEALEQSVAIKAYTIEHFLAAANAKDGGELDSDQLGRLDATCKEAVAWIEADWDRNRFSDDSGKADLHNTNQHLLHSFRRMHEYHKQLLAKSTHR
ncbi:MAG: hypothetical protein DHS20C16_17090 [Phycisphaerae bacterium]|nr:MAG: hypothetical protein DHS20C16_17090 [Phycisphaerae bacterium]